jgi:transmembrane protein EpsG
MKNILVTVNIIIACIAIIANCFFGMKRSKLVSYYNQTLLEIPHSKNANRDHKGIFILFCFLILLFISGARGNFTQDYDAYIEGFRLIRTMSVTEIIKKYAFDEVGFKLIVKVIGMFSDNPVIYMSVMAAITLFFYFRCFVKHSADILLSVLILISIGSYYSSFNVTYNFMAAAMYANCLDYVYEHKAKKYFLVVFLVSLIHKSAIIMLPVYFIYKIKIKRLLAIIVLVIPASWVGYIALPVLISIASAIRLYVDFSYGISTGLSFTSILKPVVVMVFLTVEYRKLNLLNEKERVWFYLTVLYFMFFILGLRSEILIRFTYYCNSGIFLLIPMIVKRVQKYKGLFYMFVCTMLVAFSIVSYYGKSRVEYTFFWQY